MKRLPGPVVTSSASLSGPAIRRDRRAPRLLGRIGAHPQRPAMPGPVAHWSPLVTDTPTTTDPNDVAPAVASLDTIVSLSKRRGFVFPSSEIYGGINAVWDYGPLGVELKNNVKRAWWRAMVQEREDIVGLDAGILMHPQVWITSGHVGSFSDPLVECGTCHRRYRLDELPGAEGLTRHGPERPDGHRAVQARLPERRRPAVAAAPVQPDVPDLHGPGPGRGVDRLLPARDRPGLVRQLQERPAELAQEAAVRDRPDREVVPQRDQPRQLRLPDARVRADGDAVLRPARTRRRGSSRSGCRGASTGTRATASRRRGCGSASTPRTSWPTTRRRRSTSSTASRSAGRSWRGSTTGATSTCRATRRSPARTSSTSTRRPKSTSSRSSSRRPAGRIGRRSRS